MSTTAVDNDPSSRPLQSLTPLHLIGLILAAITGGIHLWLGVEESSLALFTAGVGFAIGIVAVTANIRRLTVVKLGIPFTATQTVYYLATHFDQITLVSATDKVVQIGLIGILFLIARRS
ncbi:hypothetical protein [Halovenus amylolytica]|uniref:hypothetical protein n=1 Tax=Halovenus amylolytica TaxID=2500550 RepID=UPI003D6BF1A4